LYLTILENAVKKRKISTMASTLNLAKNSSNLMLKNLNGTKLNNFCDRIKFIIILFKFKVVQNTIRLASSAHSTKSEITKY
jgi:hypothetical protein